MCFISGKTLKRPSNNVGSESASQNCRRSNLHLQHFIPTLDVGYSTKKFQYQVFALGDIYIYIQLRRDSSIQQYTLNYFIYFPAYGSDSNILYSNSIWKMWIAIVQI